MQLLLIDGYWVEKTFNFDYESSSVVWTLLKQVLFFTDFSIQH